jgi:hypothetical protein
MKCQPATLDINCVVLFSGALLARGRGFAAPARGVFIRLAKEAKICSLRVGVKACCLAPQCRANELHSSVMQACASIRLIIMLPLDHPTAQSFAVTLNVPQPARSNLHHHNKGHFPPRSMTPYQHETGQITKSPYNPKTAAISSYPKECLLMFNAGRSFFIPFVCTQ